MNDSLVNKRSAAPVSPALKASCALVSIKRLTSFFESPSVVSVSASRLLVTKSPWSSAKRAVLARIFDAIGSDAALASLNPSATLLITISAGCWLDDDLPMTSEVGGVLAHPTTRLVTIRTLNNLVVVFIRLFFWSLWLLFRTSSLGHESLNICMSSLVRRAANNGLR